VILICLILQELAFGEEEKTRNKKVGLFWLSMSGGKLFPLPFMVFVFLLLTFASFVMKDSRIDC
jgi:hypothetical protein